jgi:hypothetical protein
MGGIELLRANGGKEEPDPFGPRGWRGPRADGLEGPILFVDPVRKRLWPRHRHPSRREPRWLHFGIPGPAFRWRDQEDDDSAVLP